MVNSLKLYLHNWLLLMYETINIPHNFSEHNWKVNVPNFIIEFLSKQNENQESKSKNQ